MSSTGEHIALGTISGSHHPAQNILTFRDAELSYFNPDHWRLGIPTLEILSRCLVLISGNNMSGKTSLLSLIHGVFRGRIKYREAIYLNNRFNSESSYAKLSNSINSVLIKSDDCLFPNFSIADNIRVTCPGIKLHIHNKSYSNHTPEVLRNFINMNARTLSTGGLSMLRMMRLSGTKPSLLLFDEPFLNLDTSNISHSLNTLYDLVHSYQHNFSIVVASNDTSVFNLFKNKFATICNNVEYNINNANLVQIHG